MGSENGCNLKGGWNLKMENEQLKRTVQSHHNYSKFDMNVSEPFRCLTHILKDVWYDKSLA